MTTADSHVFAHATERRWVTVMCNRKDFLPLAASRPQTGLIVLIRRKNRQAECAHLLRLIRAAGVVGITANVNFA